MKIYNKFIFINLLLFFIMLIKILKLFFIYKDKAISDFFKFLY